MEISEADARIIFELHAVAHDEGIGQDDADLMRRMRMAFPQIAVCPACFPDEDEAPA